MAVTETKATPAAVQPQPDFKLLVDENIGIHDAERKTATGPESGWYGTNNVFLRLFYQPSYLMSGRFRTMFNASAWLRTADLDPDYSKSVLRIFGGPLFTLKLVDNPDYRLQLTESPNVFKGTDVNEPEAKDWKSLEFGNYAAVSLTAKQHGLTLDAHSWWVRGLDVELAKGKKADEDGFIFGGTLLYNPFRQNSFLGTTGIQLLDNLGVYARYRKWGWQVVPEGIPAERKWWNEITFGFQTDQPFSIFN